MFFLYFHVFMAHQLVRMVAFSLGQQAIMYVATNVYLRPLLTRFSVKMSQLETLQNQPETVFSTNS